MGIHPTTIKKLEDRKRCEAVIQALKLNYSKKYIQDILTRPFNS